MDALLVLPVVDDDVEAARHGDDELLQPLVRMTAALRATRHVVKVVHALDVEWNMAAALDEGQVATRVVDFGEVDDLAVFNCHGI